MRIDRLRGLIQASDKEFEKALETGFATVIDGHYRVLGPKLICRFFELFFRVALLEDWVYHAGGILSKESIVNKFWEEFGPEEFGHLHVLDHLLETFSTAGSAEDQDAISLSESRVCRFFGACLLRAKSVWEWGDLEGRWRKLTGDFVPDLRMLRGLALLEPNPANPENPAAARVRHFDASDLPAHPPDRFRLLFQTRSRWYFDELVPYLSVYETNIGGPRQSDPQQDVKVSLELQALLLKHVRFSREASTGRQIITSILPV